MSGTQMHLLFDATAREATKFAESLFQEIDNKTVPPSLLPTTEIVWNGTPLLGTEAFVQWNSRNPRSKHEITCLDVQPFPNGGTNIINMIVAVSGSVTLIDTSNKSNLFAFSAQLVVRRPQPNALLTLQTMGYRLVHKPRNPSIKY